MKTEELAINGGEPVRQTPLPPRQLFGKAELAKVVEVFEDSWERGVDFSYQGRYEAEYTDAFCHFQGGGWADAVASGTIAIHLALAALDLPEGCDVIISPVTDPGGVTPVIMQGFKPVVADSKLNSFNIDVETFKAALTTNTRCAIITHLGGIPVDIEPILDIAKSRGILILEDCSQAHGTLYKGKRVGTFGQIAAFSTMFSKTHATGGCGGLVYTQDETLYWRLRALADRGKCFNAEDFDAKNPDTFLFPALNSNLDELSCAIGISTLAKLPAIIEGRCKIVKQINAGLEESAITSPVSLPLDCLLSPFFHTLCVDTNRLKVSKNDFAQAIRAEGIAVNPDYKFVVSEWRWMQKYLEPAFSTPNASNFRESSFNLLFHEKYSSVDVQHIIESILKVESVYSK